MSESGASGNSTFHGQMSSNKQLVIGTDSRDTGQTKRLRVYRKRTGTAFTSADLANKTFDTKAGHRNGQYVGICGRDDRRSGLTNITSQYGSLRPGPLLFARDVAVISAGIVTVPSNPHFTG